MAEHACDYLIVGAGLAGASAVEGIRERDPKRSITVIGAEKHLPYDRPPLSKKLWFGKKKVKAFTYMPYFFSDLFEFGYEAVGEVNSRMETRADWQKPFETGVIYYLRNGRIRGAMMCNVWEKVEAARELIRSGASAKNRLT